MIMSWGGALQSSHHNNNNNNNNNKNNNNKKNNNKLSCLHSSYSLDRGAASYPSNTVARKF